MSHTREHNEVPGRKPGTERCKDCSWTFPCREESCGHLDCIEFRGRLPKCHYCQERVQGPMGGVRSPGSTVPELAVMGEADATWTAWNVHGVTRAIHYACRAKHASPAELARWGELDVQADPSQNSPLSDPIGVEGAENEGCT